MIKKKQYSTADFRPQEDKRGSAEKVLTRLNSSETITRETGFGERSGARDSGIDQVSQKLTQRTREAQFSFNTLGAPNELDGSSS